MKHADYLVEEYDNDFVWIVDLNRGGKSITNDAEDIVKRMDAFYPGRRVIYKDTTGHWDELTHRNGKFVNFNSGVCQECLYPIFPSDKCFCQKSP